MTSRRSVLFAGLAGASLGLWPAASAQDWRVLPDRIEAADPARALPYNVFLPAGYDPAKGPYPVLLLLHGAGVDEQFWAGQIRLWRAVEEGQRAGYLPKLIAVMPGSRNTWWLDRPGTPIESAVIEDLLADVAAKYPVMTAREGRAIAGYSAGAFGALRIAMKHPALFGAAALWAPAIYADVPPALSAARRTAAFANADGIFDPLLWKAETWPTLLPGYIAQPLRVPIFVAAGDDDRLETAFEAALLAKTLAPYQPDAIEFRVVDGGHTMRVWERTIDEALAFMFAHLTRLSVAHRSE